MDVIFVVGRVMLVFMFVAGGAAFHLGQRAAATQAARQMGAPLPTIGVPLTGVAMVVGALMVALGVWADVGALILALNVLMFAVFMHPFWRADDATRDDQMQHFMKNLTICGGMLVLFWVFNQHGADAPLTVTDPLLGRF